MALAEPLAESMGYEILLAEEATEHGKKALRIFLDRAGDAPGINIADCERFSRALDPILDVEGDLESRYNLEISSPGLNRPLVKPGHFQAQMGNVISVLTRTEISGRRNFKGILLQADEEGIEVKVDVTTFKIPLAEIKKAHLDFFATQETQKGIKKI